MMPGDYFVYVIQNYAGKYYIGLTDDPVRRLSDHNSGVSISTQNRALVLYAGRT